MREVAAYRAARMVRGNSDIAPSYCLKTTSYMNTKMGDCKSLFLFDWHSENAEGFLNTLGRLVAYGFGRSIAWPEPASSIGTPQPCLR